MKMAKALITVFLALNFTSTAFAKDIQYPAVIASKISDRVIVFEQCFNEKTCRTIGKKSGYDIDDLNFSPKKRKTKAVVIGTGELVVGVFGGWIAGWAAWGAGATGAAMWTTTATVGVATTTAPSYIDALNPVLQWKMANIEAQIHKNNLSNEDKVIIEIADDIQMAKFTQTLQKVLGSIK